MISRIIKLRSALSPKAKPCLILLGSCHVKTEFKNSFIMHSLKCYESATVFFDKKLLN